MKTPALLMALALTCGGAALAADTQDSHDRGTASGGATTSAHQLASDFKSAVHKLGRATRHALQRADSAVHRMAHHDSKA